MSSDNKIDRKEAIKRAGLLLGGVVFAPNILGVLNGCTATPGDWSPTLFSNDQARLVTALADVILPADDSPAASELGVPQFIETMVDEVYSDDQQQEFLDGLDKFSDDYRAEIQAEYFDGNDTDKYDFTYHQNRLAVEEDPGSNPFILTFKELTLLGYFTSEVGASEVLRYQAVPGAYEGCIPYEDVGKTWATD
jgi:hypothetical protein